MENLIYRHGLPRHLRAQAASLYDKAFGQKLSVAIGSNEKRLALLEESLVPEFSLVALAGNKLAGVAGYQTADGSFTSGFMSGRAAYKYLGAELGYAKAGWAALILSLFERSADPGELLMDGIAVRRDFRGRGIGGQLLNGRAFRLSRPTAFPICAGYWALAVRQP